MSQSDPDVFISYSRKDQAFVRTLDQAFRALDRIPWVDWSSIRKGEEWWTAIQRGIEGANTFVFVISPDSIESPVCRAEIDHAAQHHKRFLPIVRREGFDPNHVHPNISSHNWLFFRETDSFEAALRELITAIDTDLEYVQMHTRLLVRAIEWQSKAQNSSYLLRGTDLDEAERWLLNAAKKPSPTDLQIEYIHTSRKAELARLRALQKSRRIVILTTLLANLMVSIAGGIWFYKIRVDQATQRIQENLVSAVRMGTIGTNGDRFAELANLKVPPGTTPDNSPLYREQQQRIASVHAVFPNAFPRTYIAGEPGKILWVGDISRILRRRKPTAFLEPFDANHSERNVFDNQETVIMQPYTDELGRWISASAPIKTASGQIVGGMRVDFTEAYVVAERDHVRSDLVSAYLVVLVWLLTLSWIILRAMRSIDFPSSKTSTRKTESQAIRQP